MASQIGMTTHIDGLPAKCSISALRPAMRNQPNANSAPLGMHGSTHHAQEMQGRERIVAPCISPMFTKEQAASCSYTNNNILMNNPLKLLVFPSFCCSMNEIILKVSAECSKTKHYRAQNLNTTMHSMVGFTDEL